MHPLGIVIGACVVIVVLWDAFETMIFPRRVTRRFRLTRAIYRAMWLPLRAIGARRRPGKKRDKFLSFFGPLSLLCLLFAWGCMLVVGYALLFWGAWTELRTPPALVGLSADLYFSGATLCTLSLGDVAPTSQVARALTLAEGATGLGFFAMVIGYLPILSQAFSRREVNISLLDARAGSPPSAGELLVRHVELEGAEPLGHLLEQWDGWAAELLETHISFPVLAYYRSQHDNQSWVAALTTILDACALIVAGLEHAPLQRARLTFAMARHAAVDLSRVFHLPPRPDEADRLPPAELARLRERLAAAGLALREGPAFDEKLRRLRRMYEPYMNALGTFLLMPLPPWVSPEGARDNWQSLS
jgi:hypothetical protein